MNTRNRYEPDGSGAPTTNLLSPYDSLLSVYDTGGFIGSLRMPGPAHPVMDPYGLASLPDYTRPLQPVERSDTEINVDEDYDENYSMEDYSMEDTMELFDMESSVEDYNIDDNTEDYHDEDINIVDPHRFSRVSQFLPSADYARKRQTRTTPTKWNLYRNSDDDPDQALVNVKNLAFDNDNERGVACGQHEEDETPVGNESTLVSNEETPVDSVRKLFDINYTVGGNKGRQGRLDALISGALQPNGNMGRPERFEALMSGALEPGDRPYQDEDSLEQVIL